MLQKIAPDYSKALEWDIETWSRALAFWEKQIAQKALNMSFGLELGARNGGLSWFFAKQYKSRMVCSDIQAPAAGAESMHQDVSGQITYAIADACALPFPTAAFDFVVFKSMLGAIGRGGNQEKPLLALQEMHRVLKPGGVLFFAENLKGAFIHRIARRIFVPWGKSWQYMSRTKLEAGLAPFGQFELHTTGFLAILMPGNPQLKSWSATLDQKFAFLPESWRYMAYGLALK